MTWRRGQGIVSARHHPIVSVSTAAVTPSRAHSHRRPSFHLWKAPRYAAATFALLGFLGRDVRRARAEDTQTAGSAPAVTAAETLPAGLDLNLSVPSPEPNILTRWWFWTAMGAVAVATAAAIVASSHGSARPATNLGNQVFAP